MMLACGFNSKLEVGRVPSKCNFGTNDCFNTINTAVVGIMCVHVIVLSLYALLLTVYFRLHNRALVQATWSLGYVLVQSNHVSAPSATGFETYCYGLVLDSILIDRYLCLDNRLKMIGTSTIAVMSLGFVPLHSGILIRFVDYCTLFMARLLPPETKRSLRLSIPVATLTNNTVESPMVYTFVSALPVHDLRISNPKCIA
ncbi:hypothetical protein ACHHYP_00064 [Achlya hypogyna]|uniref:Uncharacterized protein n=1 Tax=Achlya hypogyna TaxID=1202772 RepID=A0A1V9ZCB1_ACHHY|nr:hypothetical protein ACHHYP_00064 [Achlya hypogyna]